MNFSKNLKHCISIDIETTGLNPEKNGMVSVGAVSFVDDWSFCAECYLRDDVEIDPKALEVNGEDEEMLLSRTDLFYPSEYEALIELIDYCKIENTFVIIGKNPKFDRDFLLAIWVRNGHSAREFPFTYRVINWADMAIPLMLQDDLLIPANGISSDQFSEYLGVEEEPKPHTALNGARQNKKCVLAILNRYLS